MGGGHHHCAVHPRRVLGSGAICLCLPEVSQTFSLLSLLILDIREVTEIFLFGPQRVVCLFNFFKGI